MYSFTEPCLGAAGDGVGAVVVVDGVVVVVVVVVVFGRVFAGTVFAGTVFAGTLVAGTVCAGATPPREAVATVAGASRMAAVKARTRPKVRDINGH